MEGDGQSMLAIVQSLRDAGLLVTMVDGKHSDLSSSAFLAISTNCQPPVRRPLEHRSLGNNTRFKSTHHSSTQATDARYTSVYQLSHCGAEPTSPPVHLPEFPPQRATPHFTEGNFEVRGWRNSACQYTPVRSAHSCRSSLHWPNRGSGYHYADDTSAFAHSLRKYPNLSPNRSLSAELIQRLLTYSQTKSLSKSSCHATNVRASKTPVVKTECMEKTSKNVQTYTRTKNERVDKGINTTHSVKCQSKLSYPTDKSRHSLKDKQQNYTYDYLKKTKPRGWNSRGTEVRYLTDVTRCIKEAIRNICDETPVICPRVQSRYSQHRRLHHCPSNGHPSTSINNEGNVNGSSPTASRTCGIPRCPSPDNVCPRLQTRYNQHKGMRGMQKSRSSLSHMEVQVSPSPVAREASVMTKCETDDSLSHVCKAPDKTCCFCKKPLPCHCKSEMDRKIEKEVLEWMKEIPVYSDDSADNKCLRNMLAGRLSDTLQKIIKVGEFGKIRVEIDKCINVLPMWCPDNEKDKTALKNQIAENLMNRLKQFTKKDLLKEQILLWFEELPFKDKIKPELQDKFIDNLINRLKAVEKLPNSEDHKRAVKNEIVNVLSEISGIDKDVIERFAEKLADKLVSSNKKEMTWDSNIHKLICDWIDSRPEFVENEFITKDNLQTIDELAQKVTELQKERDKDKIKEAVKSCTVEWIDNAFKSKNIIFDTPTKSNIAQHFINQLYPRRTKGDQKYVKLVSEWLKSVPELSHFLDNNKMGEQLAEELLQMQKDGFDDENLLEAVIKWISNLTKQYGIDIKPELATQFAKRLIAKLSLPERKPIKVVGNFKEAISDRISHLLKDITVNDKIKKNLQKKMTDIMSNTADNVLPNEKTKKDLVELLNHESNMSPQEAEELASTVVDSTKAMPLTEDSELGLKRGMEEKFANALEDSFSDLLPDEVIRGKDPQSVRNELYPFLESSTPDGRLENIERAREMSVPPSDRSSIAKHRRSSIISPSIDTLKQNMKQKVFDFIENELVPHCSVTAEDMKSEAKDFINKLPQLLNKDNFEESVHQEINDYLSKLHISPDKIKKELADKLAHKLLRPKFESSTPRKEKIQPRRLTFDSSIIPSVHFPDESNLDNLPETEEEKYTKDLTRIVKNWLDKMPISLNNEESVRFKDTVINDLVADMIDRQKYLQLNPRVLTSDVEELENLKYQVFRWLNKVMNPNDIDVIMPQSEALIQSVKAIPVPQLGIPSGRRKDEKQAQGQVAQREDVLQDEISLWVDNIPTHLRQSPGQYNHNQMISELAHNLQDADSKSMDDNIIKWLQKYFKFTNQDDINKVAYDLKTNLARKGFSKDASWMLVQDSGEFIEENLQGGILDWMKKSPYYQTTNAQDINTLEKVVEGMAKGIKNVFESAFTAAKDEDTNKLFIDEIVKHIKKVPMDPKKRSEEGVLRNTASELLRYLKELQMFQNISDRRQILTGDYLNKSSDGETSLETNYNSRGIGDDLHENLREFIESLPIKKGKLTREREEAVKHNIANKLRYIIGELNMNPEVLKDDFLYDHILEDELDNLISALPLDVATEDSAVTVKKSLVNKIKKAKEIARNQIAGHIYKQQLRDTISKTLPPSEDLSDDEQASLELLKESVADAFINLNFNDAKGEISDKYKNKINNEISKFCDDYLKRHPLTPIDSRKLNNDLYEMLKNVTFSSENEVRDEVEETKIKDLIIDRANELPLKEDKQSEKLQAYKILSIMSKRIRKLEKDKEFIEHYENVLRDEILKWTKKLPLEHCHEENINDFANNLISELKRYKSSRSCDSSMMDTIAPTDIEMSRIPPSTLSQPDRDHLEQIRKRTASGKDRINSPIQTHTGINPTPIDAGSQTEEEDEVRPREKAGVPKIPSIEATTSVEPHVCLSPTCGLRRARPCIESEKTFCHIKPKSCNKAQHWNIKGQTEHLLSCDWFPSESGSRDLRSKTSCECQPQYIPYKFSPTHSRRMPQSCTPRSPSPNIFKLPQNNVLDDTFPNPKRCKRKDQSPPRQEKRPRKTVRSRAWKPRCANDVQGMSPRLDTHGNGLGNLPEMNCGNSKRELLISDDEFEEYDRIEKMKCDCKEMALSGRHAKFRGPCKDACINRCPKCCGVYCPHPTNLFFRN